MRARRLVSVGGPLFPIAVAGVIGLSSCSSDTLPSTADPQLSPAAQQGLDVAQARGCTNCHSTSGRPSTGPTWKGIWGTEVELADGRRLVVDADYVRRSIEDPRADEVTGFASSMPEIALSDDEIAAITDLIRELGPGEGGSG